jgi:hypothetical protein
MTFVGATGWIGAGVAVWAAHFTVVYGFTALACARQVTAPIPWVVGVATVVAAAAAAAIAVAGLRRRDRFEPWLGATVAGAAFIAIVWEGLPLFLVTQCA